MYQNDHDMNPRNLEHRVKTVNQQLFSGDIYTQSPDLQHLIRINLCSAINLRKQRSTCHLFWHNFVFTQFCFLTVLLITGD